MAKICEKCGKEFPFKVDVDGKIRNLCNRKYCLECMPFKSRFIIASKEIKFDLTVGKEIEWECPKHGITTFVIEQGICVRRRCKKCRVDAVTKARRTRKKKLVELFGGGCKICGYSKCQQSLQFHHLDPSEKKYGISSKGACRSLDEMLMEAKKCVLLCANCHIEVENGITKL